MFGNLTSAAMQAIMKNITADGGNLIANAQDNRLAPKTLSFNQTPQSLGPPVTAAETLAATPQAAEPQSIAPAEVADNRLAPKTLSFNFTPQSLGPSLTAAEMLAADSPSEPEAPEGFEFIGTVNTTIGGPETKAFRKIGDDTGFTIYQREITAGKNKGKQGFFFDDIGDEVATARTGGYLNANDAFNQGRTRSSNYINHFNTMMDRGVELGDDAIKTLNAALAHHDKYLGGQQGFANRRENLIDTMNAVQNYENYAGNKYVIGEEGAKLYKEPFRREGIEYVEGNNGQMVPKEALDALKMTVGLMDEDLRYDVNGDGRISSADSVGFMRYGSQEDYDQNNDFFSNFYNPSPTPAPETTAPDFSKYIDTFTTAAVGEEDGGKGFLTEDFVDPAITTFAVGEEDGGLPIYGVPTTIGEATTLAMGEEEGSLPPPIGEVTTMAMGEEDGGLLPTTPAPVYDPGQQINTDPFFNPVTPIQAPNVFDGINYNNPRENLGTTVPTAPATPTVPVVGGNRTYGSYGTYAPPNQVQAVTGVGDNRTYNGFEGTGTPTTFAAPTFVTPTPQDNSGVLDPLREGLGSLFDRAKALQGQSTYVNPFLRPGG